MSEELNHPVVAHHLDCCLKTQRPIQPCLVEGLANAPVTLNDVTVLTLAQNQGQTLQNLEGQRLSLQKRPSEVREALQCHSVF